MTSIKEPKVTPEFLKELDTEKVNRMAEEIGAEIELFQNMVDAGIKKMQARLNNLIDYIHDN